jgi:hypothetical protein
MSLAIKENRLITDGFKDIEKLEADLWEAADNLRANSKLTSSDYFMPVLGVIFLRHAANRFEAARKQIEEDQAAGRMPKRKVLPEDYIRQRALWLPGEARNGNRPLHWFLLPTGWPQSGCKGCKPTCAQQTKG